MSKRSENSARWQRKQVERGNCSCCGKPREVRRSIYCDACREKKLEAMRRRRGGGAWEPGKPGRPPKNQGKS